METPSQTEVAAAAMTPSSVLKRKNTEDHDAPPHHQHREVHRHQPHPHHQQYQHAVVNPAPKAQKTHNHLQINYLARQNEADLPLASTRDSMPEVVDLLNQYQGVLERHESLACNLGARPLGPILIRRFERLFEGPPKVLKSHGKEGVNITWLDVVEFARNKPEQFTLGQMSEGRKVCQIYTKQCRVQISEEDYVLISSGIPQKMIPPQPIVEDEEKELGTLEILEERLDKICKLADQVAARARQLNHRIRGRKTAILDRRATEPSFRALSPSHVALANGSTQSPTPGFVAVNSRPQEPNGSEYSKNGASSTTRKELLDRFTSLEDRKVGFPPSLEQAVRSRASVSASGPVQIPVAAPMASHHTGPEQELAAMLMAANNAPGQHQPHYAPHTNVSGPSTPAAIPSANYFHHHNTGSPSHQPATLASNAGPQQMPPSAAPRPNAQSHQHPHPHEPQHAHHLSVEKEKPDDGPFKAEMVARMEALGKGERIIPPCDRCRRLHMDCLKNLTACLGCTKKHAKCSWREVREDEMIASRATSIMRPQHISNDSYQGAAPLDPAMHSPLFESAYRPADADTPSYASHGYDQPASTGTRDDSGSEHADRPSRASTNMAEAEAAYTAAQRARNSSSVHASMGITADGHNPPESDPAARAAYLDSLNRFTPRPSHQTYDSPSYTAAAHRDTPDIRHDDVPTGLAHSPAPVKDTQPDVAMSGMDSNQVEMIRQRLLRAQKESPDNFIPQKHEDHPTPEQRVTTNDTLHNRIWSDEVSGAHASNDVQPTTEPHRDTSDGVQSQPQGAAPAA